MNVENQRPANVRAMTYRIERLRELFPRWDTYTKREKNHAVRGSEALTAAGDAEAHNVSCVGHHRLLGRLLDPEDPLTSNEMTLELALGTGTGTPDTTDSGLFQSVYQGPITDTVQSLPEVLYSTFVDSNEANASGTANLTEAGLVAVVDDALGGESYFLNHSTIGSIAKSSAKTATIDVFLGYEARP